MILDRVLDEATAAGKLSPRVDRTYVIELPEITPGADAATAGAASTLITALLAAANAGWISRETGMKLLFDVLEPEVNMAEEMERIELETAQRLAMQAAAAALSTTSGTPDAPRPASYHAPSIPGPARSGGKNQAPGGHELQPNANGTSSAAT